MIRIRAVDVIPRVFDPFPGAKLSMCTALSLGHQVRTKGSRRGPNCLANVVDDLFDQCRVVALSHNPDQRFSTGLSNDQASASFELSLGGGDALLDPIAFDRFAPPTKSSIL